MSESSAPSSSPGQPMAAPRLSSQPVALVLLISWLIPGYGFVVNGLRRRGLLLLVVIEGLFLIGCAFRGSVLKPDFSAEGFNIVSLLSFMTQMFNGLLSTISLLPDLLSDRYRILPYDEPNPWADLGAFFMLISGGLNYFLIVSTYDHFYGSKRPWLRENRPPRPRAASPAKPAEESS